MSTTWYVTQGCYLTHATPIAEPQPGQPTQILAPNCSVPVRQLILDVFGPHFFTIWRALMMSASGTLLMLLLIQSFRLAQNLCKSRVVLKILIQDPQFSMYFGWTVSSLLILLWYVDPYETLGIFGSAGRFVISLMLFCVFSSMMTMMFKTWTGVLSDLGILKLPESFLRVFFVLLACTKTFCSLPLKGSFLWGFQYVFLNIWLLVFSLFNSYLGWLVLKQYRESNTHVAHQAAGNMSMNVKIRSATTLKIILVAFGISSCAIGALFLTIIIPVIFFLDAASGSDLQHALIQSREFIAWRIFLIITGVSFGGVVAISYFLVAFRNVSSRR